MIALKRIFPALLLSLLFAQVAFAAKNVEECDIKFDSMSLKEGQIGDTFLMYGQWGDTQGEKLPAINRASLEPLEVVSWSNSQVTVRIPSTLSTGIHKVGVYCSDPRKGGTYGTDWKFFTVKAADDKTQLTQRKTPQRETDSFNSEMLEENDIGDPLQAYEKKNSEIWIILGAAIAVALLLYSRRKSRK